MGRFSHTGFRDQMSLEPGLVLVPFQITTGSGGAVSSYRMKGATLAKTGSETGRYTVTLDGACKRIFFGGAFASGAADAAYTTAKGIYGIPRNVDPAAGTFDIQMVRSDTAADAEVEDNAVIHGLVILQTSEARG